MGNKKLATFRIDTDEWQAFQEWAKRSGTTASSLLVDYIDECLDRPPSRASTVRLERAAINIDKRINSIDKKVTLLEASIERQIEDAVKKHMTVISQQTLAKSEHISIQKRNSNSAISQDNQEEQDLQALPDLESLRDRILKALTEGKGKIASTSPQYKAASKALTSFIDALGHLTQ